MKNWLSDSANVVLVIACITTGVGLYAALMPPQNGTILAFSGSLWVVWSTVLKERRKRNGNGSNGNSNGKENE